MTTTIAENLAHIRSSLPAGVRLIAVSKYKPVEDLRAAYDAGQRLFGENHALEMRDKHALLPPDIEWHYIGHLQTNKIKYIAPFVALIHSIDSPGLLAAVNREAHKAGRTIPCLLQFHVAQEDTKYGLTLPEADALLASPEYRNYQNVHITGVMGMATHTPDSARIEEEFATLRAIFTHLKQQHFAADPAFCELSMGMSQDYPIALRQGSTLVRVGSAIFGPRQYPTT